MANEKRLISYDVLIAHLDSCIEQGKGLFKSVCVAIKCFVEQMPTVGAVEVVQFNALKSLVNGEWVDCKLVQEALGIDFATGLKMFDFSRTAEWNPAPLNGQKITIKFRLKNAVVHGQWIPTKTIDVYSGIEIIDGYICDHCGIDGIRKSTYCPNCGADMRERKDNDV